MLDEDNLLRADGLQASPVRTLEAASGPASSCCRGLRVAPTGRCGASGPADLKMTLGEGLSTEDGIEPRRSWGSRY